MSSLSLHSGSLGATTVQDPPEYEGMIEAANRLEAEKGEDSDTEPDEDAHPKDHQVEYAAQRPNDSTECTGRVAGPRRQESRAVVCLRQSWSSRWAVGCLSTAFADGCVGIGFHQKYTGNLGLQQGGQLTEPFLK